MGVIIRGECETCRAYGRIKFVLQPEGHEEPRCEKHLTEPSQRRERFNDSMVVLAVITVYLVWSLAHGWPPWGSVLFLR